MPDRVLVGCANFQVSMSTYFSTHGFVEINRTFYVLPRQETLKRWVRMAPPGFVFSVKASRKLTHDGAMNLGTDLARQGLKETVLAASTLQARYLLLQTPPSFGPERLEAVRAVIQDLKQKLNSRISYEPRGPSWEGHGDDLADSLQGLASVVVDPFRQKEVHWEVFHYFRLHGLGERAYVYSYSTQEIRRLKDMLKDLEGEVVVVFNNTDAYKNSLQLMEELRREGIELA